MMPSHQTAEINNMKKSNVYIGCAVQVKCNDIIGKVTGFNQECTRIRVTDLYNVTLCKLFKAKDLRRVFS